MFLPMFFSYFSNEKPLFCTYQIKNKPMKKLLIISVIFLYSFGVAYADFFESVEKLATGLSPLLKGKTVSIGLIEDKKSGKRLRLSDSIADELSIALKTNQIEVVIDEKNISKEDKANFRQGVSLANTIITGYFQKWGSNYNIRCQILDAASGKVLGGKTVQVAANDIPADMLKPVVQNQQIVGRGSASISYQCMDGENPCPPKSELKRRAIEVAKLMALQNISEITGVDTSTLSSVVNGRLTNSSVKTKTHKVLNRLEYGNPIAFEDELSIEITMEVE